MPNVAVCSFMKTALAYIVINPFASDLAPYQRGLTPAEIFAPEPVMKSIRELRGLLDAFNEAKKTAGLTIVKMLVTGLVMALLAGAFVKFKLFGGAQ